jgi:hypothetical protein
MSKTWYCVVGWGGAGGAAKRTPEAAWASALRGVPEWDIGSYRARHHLMLVEGTTRAAVESADVSRARGRHKRGEWWATSWHDGGGWAVVPPVLNRRD